ncbi:DUF2059 domain-containing protein [Pseudoduganella aquatica]|uniref:DUF2059 domain-containing protein n=1 Tax=Pseudoduganella aquatica TaxID=2660641 RepID=A0A7X4HCX1_9BURK|nr:DUF2059 domain-containing protein [Pseudoduganella aquatica]MYN08042.1 DUF2059 domain-containing protein [Pseudoduganella aquatica]
MKKIVALLAAALALSCAPAMAQNAVPSAESTAAAKQLMEAINARGLMQASMQQMTAQMPQMLRAMSGGMIETRARGMTPAKKAAAQAELEKMIPAMTASLQKFFADPALFDELERETTAIYARNYTVDEMRELLAFYRSPIGAKMLATMPKVMQESMQTSQKIILPRMGKIVEEMTANLVN